MDKFNFDHAQFDYEPYPVCYIPNFLSTADYKALADTYPTLDLFKHKPALGNKYSLAEKNNQQFYFDFLKANPCWKEFFERVKSKQFIEETFAFLKDNNIDLNIRRFWFTRRMSRRRRSWVGRIANKKLL